MRNPDTDWVYFDVDDTLLMWNRQNDADFDTKHISIKYRGQRYALVPHLGHISRMKGFHESGYRIVVWSAGGRAWAAKAVRSLGLEQYVHHILSKPRVYVDDLHCSQFMDYRIYDSYELGEIND